MAHEVKGSSHINNGSHIENAETSSVGRALGFLGIGIDTSIASADEVQNAVQNQTNQPVTQTRQAAVRRQENNVEVNNNVPSNNLESRICECGEEVQARISRRTHNPYWKCENCGEWVNE
jgi:ribose 1,5-bisphosphokinase PhnN